MNNLQIHTGKENKMEEEETSKRKRKEESLFSFSLLHVDKTIKEVSLLIISTIIGYKVVKVGKC